MATLIWLRPGCCLLPASGVSGPCEAFHVVCEDGSILAGLPPAPASARRITPAAGPATLWHACLHAFRACHPSVPVATVSASTAADIPSAIARHVTSRRAALTPASLDIVITSLAVHDAVRTMDDAVSASLRACGVTLRCDSSTCTPAPSSSDPVAIRAVVESIGVDAGVDGDDVPGMTLSVWRSSATEEQLAQVKQISTSIVHAAGATVSGAAVHASVRDAAVLIVGCALELMLARAVAKDVYTSDGDAPAMPSTTSNDAVPADARTVLTDASSVSTESRAHTGNPVRSRASAYALMMTSPPTLQAAVSMGALRARTVAAACGLLRRHAAVSDASAALGLTPGHAHATLLEYVACIQDWLVRREVAHAVVATSPMLCEYAGCAPLSGTLPWTVVPSGRGAVPASAASATPRKAEASSWLSIMSMTSSTPAASGDARPITHAPFPAMSWPAMCAALAADAPPATGVPSDAAERFWTARTGFPLVDAAITCLLTYGYAPPPLYALLHVFWCKYMLRPWSEGMRGLLQLTAVCDAPMHVLSWQWNAGLASDCSWTIPMDAADTAHGWLREDVEWHAGADAFDGAWYLWARLCPALPPHAHSMAHPYGVEFARGPDPYAAFVRTLLPLPCCLPDAYAYAPFSAPAALQAALCMRLDVTAEARGGAATTTLPANIGAWTRLAATRQRSGGAATTVTGAEGRRYAPPLVSAMKARQVVLELVLALMHSVNPGAAPVTSPATAHAHDSSTRTLLRGLPAPHAQLQRFIRGRAQAGYDAVWGAVHTWPLLVEEDASLLLTHTHAGMDDGWEEIVDDAERRLRVYMKARSDTPVKTVLATAVMPRHTSGGVFEAITVLKKYVTWDRTWQHVSAVGEPLDAYNEPIYYIADAPPPPYSYIVTQRDFVMFRHVTRDVHSGMDVVVHRNAAHASSATTAKFIRGEALGVVGFTVQPCTLPAGLIEATQPSGDVLLCSPAAGAATSSAAGSYSVPGGTQVVLVTAADPKGAIPSYLVNFVAKRTPRIWVDRLTEACDRFDRSVEQ